MIQPNIRIKACVAALTLCGVVGLEGQIAFTGSYQQDFDVLGADTSWLEGWNGVNVASSPAAPLTLGISTGSSTGGGLYNVGSSGSTDRALGSLAAGSTIPRFGVQFQNTSGETYTGIQLSGVMEQWRSGSSAAVNEVLAFEYSFDATGIDDASATWFGLGGMDMLERLTESASSTAVDGNLPENQNLMAGTIEDVMWLDQGVLTLRWTDLNDAGNDGMYALDNFSMTAVPEPSVYALVGLGILGLLSRPLRR